ncbi:hypothetical protein [Microtetraspora malaysiensis]|uniref:Uncharacterized protein n=1 Tax=Microtetraspora malaysiensis TaxID=161358 RepID=A0ABW6SYD3_9ACTN
MSAAHAGSTATGCTYGSAPAEAEPYTWPDSDRRAAAGLISPLAPAT